jgi:CrcB protein
MQQSLTNIFLVAMGGALGSISRYLFGGWVQELGKNADFPYGTLSVNLIGCLIIGFLSEYAEVRGAFTPEVRALVFVGVLGGFTTFSSFSNETVNLFRSGQVTGALINVAANVGLGLLLVVGGRALADLIWR